MAHKKFYEPHLPKVMIIGVHAPYNHTKNIDSYFAEFLNLVKANEVAYDDAQFIRLREIDNATFFTKGKVEELIKICKEKGIDHVIVSEPLTSVQERNLTDLLTAKVFDRTALILDIFEKQATTLEGKTQVAIAMLQYKKSRLAGKGVYMSQQAGFIGGRGLGETAKERETRHIENQILKLRRELEHQQEIRKTQRKRRLATGIPMICLVGYTNAGKSTIMNALTKSDVLAEDKLFATLDTTTREMYIDHHKKGVLIDTVGFIQFLPPQLIDAFKSTLSELQYADLLLHVVDISDPNWESHIEAVLRILADLEVEKEMLFVFNKVDQIDNIDVVKDIHKYLPHVVISARSKDGIQPLVKFLAQWQPSRVAEHATIQDL